MRSFIVISALFLSLVVAGAAFLFQMPEVLAAPGDLGLGELASQGSGLPTDTPASYTASIIRWVLGIIGVALVALVVYGGVMYATSAGNEQRVETAKKILTYAIIGIVIVFSAFIVSTYVISALSGQGGGTSSGGGGGGSSGYTSPEEAYQGIRGDTAPTNTSGQDCLVTDDNRTCCKSSSGAYDNCYDRTAANTDSCNVDSQGRLCCPTWYGRMKCSD